MVIGRLKITEEHRSHKSRWYNEINFDFER